MTAWYNEHDPNAAAWVRELIAAGEIAEGEVDERDIRDVRPDELRADRQLHLFAGIAGWSAALRLAGWPDDRPLCTVSCPCPSFSAAGGGAGFADERHLWPAAFHLIEHVRPPVILGEQVTHAIAFGWLDLVFDDLEGIGYACRAIILPACSVGAPHLRQRVWFVAEPNSEGAGFRHARPTVTGGDRTNDRISWPDGEPNHGLADSKIRGQRINRRASRHTGHAEQCNPLDAVGHAERAGRQERIGHEGVQPDALGTSERLGNSQGEREVSERGVSAWTQSEPYRSPWSDLVWLPCRDGKHRPTQSGIFPLAARLPRGVVPSGDPSPSDANETAEARVMRLRGYGNAVNVQVAAEIVRAYLDRS